MIPTKRRRRFGDQNAAKMLFDFFDLLWIQLLDGNRQSVTEMDRFACCLQYFKTVKRLVCMRASVSTCMRVVAVMITPTRSTKKTEHPSFAFARRSWRECEEKGMKATSFNTTHDSGIKLRETTRILSLGVNWPLLREENRRMKRQTVEDAPDGGILRVPVMKRNRETHREACHRRRSEDEASVKTMDLKSVGYMSHDWKIETEANGGKVNRGE